MTGMMIKASLVFPPLLALITQNKTILQKDSEGQTFRGAGPVDWLRDPLQLSRERGGGGGSLGWAAVPVVTMPRARPRLLSKYWQVIVRVAA